MSQREIETEMNSEDKATTTIPATPAQVKLNQLDRRDKIVRAVELFVLLAVVLFNVFLGLRLQQVIDENNRATVEARMANIERQGELKDYVKCVILIGFDNTPEQLATREGTEAALIKCADAKQLR